jgi:iron complex outermembrane receptor protein
MTGHLADRIVLLLVVVLLALHGTATSAEVAGTGANRPSCVLSGRVIDAETKEPLGWTSVVLLEINRFVTAHEDGYFIFPNLPPGTHTLKTYRLGYHHLVRTVTLADRETLNVVLELKETLLTTETVMIVGDAPGANGSALKPAEVLTGRKLQQQLGRTLAETLGKEPGMAQRTMGPAPARPVLRGLGGERLLILEDGGRTGDISATAPDHAVVIDPLTADRIEIIRGPAALRYGPTTMGGAINVVRGQIPSNNVGHVHGSVTLQGESVNRGLSGGGAMTGPLGPLAFRFDGSARTASDIATPKGRLLNTPYRNFNASAGLSLVEQWGFAGVAAGTYVSRYGIPGGFVGAHPKGVRIELQRQHLQAKAEWFGLFPWVQRLEGEFAFTDYFHQEFESNGALGIEFGVLTYSGEIAAHTPAWGPFSAGFVGFSGEYRDFAAGGFSFSPPTKETNLALVVFEELPLGPLTLQGAVRYDEQRVRPREKDSPRIGPIRGRAFGDVSGSLAAVYEAGSNIVAGVTLLRSFRAPSVEELFSEGPHLAAYSFDVGNPGLKSEVGWRLEAFVRYEGGSSRGQLTVFRNDIARYIFPRNTGQINYRTLLPIYQFSGLSAVLQGAEVAAETGIAAPFLLGISASALRGTLRSTGSPLPMMPPLSGKIDVRYSTSQWNAGVVARLAADQKQVDQFEQPTAGYAVVDLTAQYQISSRSMFHTFIVSVENVFNREYRMHLSRVKSVMPEPGRNVKLLYKLLL